MDDGPRFLISDEMIERSIVCDDPDCSICAWWRKARRDRADLRAGQAAERRRLEELALLAGAEANLRRLEAARRLIMPLAWIGGAAILLGAILLGTSAAAGAAPLYGAALALQAAAVLLYRATR